MSMIFSADEDFAQQLDAEDPLHQFREKFHLPLGKDNQPLIYFAGNALCLMPKSAKQIVEQELDDWEAGRGRLTRSTSLRPVLSIARSVP